MKKLKRRDSVPDYCFGQATDITPEDIKKMGAEAIAVDLDNTTVKNASYSLPEKSRRWVKNMRKAGIPVIIVTNTFIFRAWLISKKMGGVPFVPLANKPHTAALKRAADRLKVRREKIAMIGDTADKDILAANKTGFISVKVGAIRV